MFSIINGSGRAANVLLLPVYYTECKLKNTNGGDFETRLGEFVKIFSDKFLHMTARVSVDNIPELSCRICKELSFEEIPSK